MEQNFPLNYIKDVELVTLSHLDCQWQNGD